MSDTGAGLKATDPEGSFKEAVEKKCPWYFDLIEVMQDRASVRATATNMEGLSSVDNSEGSDDTGDDNDDQRKEGQKCNDNNVASGVEDNNVNFGNGGDDYSETSGLSDDDNDDEIVVIEQSSSSSNKNRSTALTPKVAKKASVTRPLSVAKGKGAHSARKRGGAADNDEFGGEVMKYLKSQKNTRQEGRDEELRRHNRALEEVAERKCSSEERLEDIGTRQVTMNLRMDLYKKYMTLKHQGTSRQMILYLFPEMRRLMEIDEQGDGDNNIDNPDNVDDAIFAASRTKNGDTAEEDYCDSE